VLGLFRWAAERTRASTNCLIHDGSEIVMTAPAFRTTRRNFLLGAAATILGGPAIVRAASLMPVRAVPLQISGPELKTPGTLGEWHRLCFYHNLSHALNAGRAMTCTQIDGTVITVAEGRRIVADARAQGWLAA
jgi:hypothetical protein